MNDPDPIEEALKAMSPPPSDAGADAVPGADTEILQPHDGELLRTTAEPLKNFEVEMAAEQQQAQDAGVSAPTYPRNVPEVPERQKVLKSPEPDKMSEEVFQSFSVNVDEKTVKITADDTDRFIRALLHDSGLALGVDVRFGALDRDVKFEVDVAPDIFLSQAMHVLSHWGKTGKIDIESNVQWVTHMQYLLIWRQVREIDGVPFTHGYAALLDKPKASKMFDLMSNIEILDEVASLPGPKFRLCVSAVVHAEAKYRRLLSNASDKSFSEAAGSE